MIGTLIYTYMIQGLFLNSGLLEALGVSSIVHDPSSTSKLVRAAAGLAWGFGWQSACQLYEVILSMVFPMSVIFKIFTIFNVSTLAEFRMRGAEFGHVWLQCFLGRGLLEAGVLKL